MAFTRETPINIQDRSDDHIPIDQLNSPNQDQIIPSNPNLLNANPEE